MSSKNTPYIVGETSAPGLPASRTAVSAEDVSAAPAKSNASNFLMIIRYFCKNTNFHIKTKIRNLYEILKNTARQRFTGLRFYMSESIISPLRLRILRAGRRSSRHHHRGCLRQCSHRLPTRCQTCLPILSSCRRFLARQVPR